MKALQASLPLVAVLVASGIAHGQTRTWLNVPGASYGSPASWNPAIVPSGTGETARFNSVSASTLDVVVPVGPELQGQFNVGELLVERGRYRFTHNSNPNWRIDVPDVVGADEITIGTLAGTTMVETVDGIISSPRVRIGDEATASVTSTRTRWIVDALTLGYDGGDGTMILNDYTADPSVTEMTTRGIGVGGSTFGTADGRGTLQINEGAKAIANFVEVTPFSSLDVRGTLRFGPDFFESSLEVEGNGQAIVRGGYLNFKDIDLWKGPQPAVFRVLGSGDVDTERFGAGAIGQLDGPALVEVRGVDNLIGPDEVATLRFSDGFSLRRSGSVATIDEKGELLALSGAVLNINAGTTLILKSSGRVAVDAERLFIDPAGSFSWQGGTLRLRGPFEVTNSSSMVKPLGGNVVVGVGRTLEASPVVRQGVLEIVGGVLDSSNGGSVAPLVEVRDFGTLRVSGSTGRWVAQDFAANGTEAIGSPRVEVLSGADVTTNAARFANDSGERAVVVVDGTGTTWDATFFQLGSDGAGQATMDLRDGASLTVTGELDVNSTGSLRMRSASLSADRITVDGSLVLASGGLGTGPVTATAANQALPMGGLRGGVDVKGTITLSALGSTLTAQGVVVQQGGDLTATIAGGPGTHVVVRDAGSTWSAFNTVDYQIGSTTTGVGQLNSLTVENGGIVNFGRNASIAPTATGGFTLSQGTVNAQQFTSGGAVVIGGSGAINARYSGPSAIIPSGALTIGDATATTGFATTGAISTFGHTLTLRDSDRAELGPTTTLGIGSTPGTIVAANGVELGAGESLNGFGLVYSTNTLARAVLNTGSIVGAGTANPLTFTGYVTGDGTIGNVVFNGTYSPGATTAKLEVGAIQMGAASTLLMQIGGLTPGSQHDQLLLDRPLTAGGTLRVTEVNLFTPTLGHEFDLFDGTILGQFATLDLPRLVSGQFWDTRKLYSTGVIRVIDGIDGDYNDDGVLDTADYTTWRDALDSSATLPNDTTPGTVKQEDYDVWVANYGQVLASLSTATSVPEPTGLVLLAIATAYVSGTRRIVRTTTAAPRVPHW